MKKLFGNIKVSALLIAVFAFSLIGNAQCPSPNVVFKPETKAGWGANSQSKSGALLTGETYEFTFIAQRGMEYRITAVGGAGNWTKENVQFTVSDSEVQKVMQDGQEVFRRFNTVVFDSRTAGPDDQCVIATSKTRKLTVTVNLIGTERPKDVQCAVVFIENRRTQQLGLR
jgi:hypothetical protein